MKNLVAEIRTLHKDTTARIGQIKGETRDILKEADDYMKSVAAELKKMAGNLKDFLAKSEEGRKKDFNALIGEIRARIKGIKGDVKDFLAKSEEKRIADFKATMKDVTEAVEGIKRMVKGTLGDYEAERKEAAGYWARLEGREVAEEVKAPSFAKASEGKEEKPAEEALAPKAKKGKK